MAPKRKQARAEAAAEPPAKSSRGEPEADVDPVDASFAKIVELVNFADLPGSCREMLALMVPKCLGTPEGERHRYQERMATIFAQVLTEAEEQLRGHLADVQSKLDNQHMDKETKGKNMEIANLALGEAQEHERLKVYAMEESDNAVSSAEEVLATAEASSTGLTSELAEAEKATERYQEALGQRLTPLKEAALTGKRDQKKVLEALSLDLEPLDVDRSLLDAMAVTFTKKLDARTKFDGIVMTHIETGIHKHLESLAAKLATAEQEGVTRKAAVAAAESTLNAARSRRQANSEALAAAEAERKERAATSRQTGKVLKDHGPYIKKCEKELLAVKSSLEHFLDCIRAKVELESPADPAEAEEPVGEEAAEAQEPAAAAEEPAAEAEHAA